MGYGCGCRCDRGQFHDTFAGGAKTFHPLVVPVHSHPQSSRNTFGTPRNTDLDNKKGTTLFREIFFNPEMAYSVENIQIFFPLKQLLQSPSLRLSRLRDTSDVTRTLRT